MKTVSNVITLFVFILFSSQIFAEPVDANNVREVAAKGMSVTEPNTAISTQLLVPVLKSKAMPKKERLQALRTLFRDRKSFSKSEQLEFLRSTKSIAADKQEDARLRADAIWAMGGIGMQLKHEKTLSDQNIFDECKFLLQTATDETENLQVRRMSITAMGDLKMKEAVPIVKVLLADKANLNRPEIARSASIALAELEPNEAIQPVGQILSNTTDPTVFGSAAYALGRTKSRDAIPLLVENRLRLKDNLSVDNALETMSETILEILEQPSDPNIVFVIQATRSLWREEQKAEYTPLLQEILANRTLLLDVRQEALKRLTEDADTLSLNARKQQISIILSLVEGEEPFGEEVSKMRQILNAQLLPITRIENQEGQEVTK